MRQRMKKKNNKTMIMMMTTIALTKQPPMLPGTVLELVLVATLLYTKMHHFIL